MRLILQAFGDTAKAYHGLTQGSSNSSDLLNYSIILVAVICVLIYVRWRSRLKKQRLHEERTKKNRDREEKKKREIKKKKVKEESQKKDELAAKAIQKAKAKSTADKEARTAKLKDEEEAQKRAEADAIAGEEEHKKAEAKAEKVPGKDRKKPLPKSEPPPPKRQGEILYVNYSADNVEQGEDWQYPIAKTPGEGCVVRSYQNGSTKRRGYKELDFEEALQLMLQDDFLVEGDVRLNIGAETRPFEPDIAIIDLKSGLNIRIDVEIDEPYAGISRQATHCLGEDELRDMYFVSRGWIVIRFTEFQIHTKEKECLAYVANYINGINPHYVIPGVFRKVSIPAKEKQWDLLQAQKWEKYRWKKNGVEKKGKREEYLNHDFEPTPSQEETPWRDLTAKEQSEEQLVIKSDIGEAESLTEEHFNSTNEHSRDKRVEFYPEPHVYLVDKIPYKSVSTVISRFFQEFDQPYWAEIKARERGITPEELIAEWEANGAEAAKQGTFLHEQIEQFYLGLDDIPNMDSADFLMFKTFTEEHRDLNPYRSEWRIFDDNKLLAGTIDLLVENENGYDMYDWKRSKKIISTYDESVIEENQYRNGLGPLRSISDTAFQRYSVQQNIYRHILESRYGISVNKMYLVVIHPNNERYHKVEVAQMQEVVDEILTTI